MEGQRKSLINHYPIGNGIVIRRRVNISIGAVKLAKHQDDLINRLDSAKASIQVVGDNKATAISRKTQGWHQLSVDGFTYSKKTIKVKFKRASR